MSNRKQETPLQRLIRLRRRRDDLLDPREGNSGIRNLNYALLRGDNNTRAKDLGMTNEEYQEYIRDANRNQEGNGKNTNKSYRKGEMKKRQQIYNPQNETFVKKDTKTGKFMSAKKTYYKGVRSMGEAKLKKRIKKIVKKIVGSGPKEIPVKRKKTPEERAQKKKEKKELQRYLSKNRVSGVKMDLYEERGGIPPEIKPAPPAPRIQREKAIFDLRDEMSGTGGGPSRPSYDTSYLTSLTNPITRLTNMLTRDLTNNQLRNAFENPNGQEFNRSVDIIRGAQEYDNIRFIVSRLNSRSEIQNVIEELEKKMRKNDRKLRQGLRNKYLARNIVLRVLLVLAHQLLSEIAERTNNEVPPAYNPVGSGKKKISGKGKGRSFLHDAAHGVFKVLPVITALATLVNKLGISAKPEEWVKKATDYLKGNESQRQFIQEDIDTAMPNDYGWKELYSFKKAGYKLTDRLEDQLAKQMDAETRKYEYQLMNPTRISQQEQGTQQYSDAVKAFIKKYTKELNGFLSLPDSSFASQKSNIRLRHTNITRSNYLYKSPILDDLLNRVNARLGQVGGSRRKEYKKQLKNILGTKLTEQYLRQFTKDEILEKYYEAEKLFNYYSEHPQETNMNEYLQLQNVMRILEELYYRIAE